MNINEIKRELVTLGGGAHALAAYILGDPDDASDAVQDAFATVLGKPAAYYAEKGPLKPWFLRVVRNRCIDLMRRRRSGDLPVDGLPDKGVSPEQAAELDDRDRELKLALATITNEQRQIVILRDHLDLSYAEIAEVLDIAPGTVMSRLHRARLALREVLKSYE